MKLKNAKVGTIVYLKKSTIGAGEFSSRPINMHGEIKSQKIYCNDVMLEVHWNNGSADMFYPQELKSANKVDNKKAAELALDEMTRLAQSCGDYDPPIPWKEKIDTLGITKRIDNIDILYTRLVCTKEEDLITRSYNYKRAVDELIEILVLRLLKNKGVSSE